MDQDTNNQTPGMTPEMPAEGQTQMPEMPASTPPAPETPTGGNEAPAVPETPAPAMPGMPAVGEQAPVMPENSTPAPVTEETPAA